MKSKTTLFAILLCTLFWVTSCGETFFSSTTAPDDKPGNSKPLSEPLSGTSWNLISFNRKDLIEDTHFSLAFSADQASGNGGCNQFFAAYRINEDQISFEGIGATEMACLEPAGLMEQEFVLLQILSEVERFAFSDGRLHLYRGDGDVLIFDPVIE